MDKIGIGITSFNRPECLKECLEHINKHTFMDNVTLYVAQDTNEDRQGVAKRKNECLRALKDCDYIFLCDDDCFPIKDGWIEFFINSCGNNHALFLNEKLHNYKGNILSNSGKLIRTYNDCGGCFMYIPKSALNKVGAFDERFNIYGFEHANWSMRFSNKERVFYMPSLADYYLYSHDYSNPNHKSSISDEEKQMHIKNNWNKFFAEPIKSIYLPL